MVGIVNGRMVDKDIGMSYHTLSIDRGLRVGSHLFAAKMEHHIEYLGQQEVWITAESPIGFRRWMIEYGLIKQKDVQHELGGVTSYKLTRDLYFETKPRLVVGKRPVPKKLLEQVMDKIMVADEDAIRERSNVDPFPNATLEELLAERGRELYCEGHRRQDLIRFGKFNNEWWEKEAGTSTDETFPIPKWATDANPNLLLDPQ